MLKKNEVRTCSDNNMVDYLFRRDKLVPERNSTSFMKIAVKN